MNKVQESKPRFKVGDWVSFPYGAMTVLARVIEDRGPIGVNGRRLYRIEMPTPEGEADRFEVREENMTAAAPPKKNAQTS